MSAISERTYGSTARATRLNVSNWPRRSIPHTTSRSSPQRPTEVPYHGSCPQCHHLHTNSPLQLPQTPEGHVRFQCEYCEHQIFGIGRTSTQTTLASVETIPVDESARRTANTPNPREAQVSPTDPRSPSTLRRSLHESAEHLSTINESYSPSGRSPSASYSEAQQPHDGVQLAGMSDSFASGPASHAPPVFQALGSGGAGSRRLSDRVQNLRSRFFGKSRGFRIPRLGVHVGLTPASQMEQSPTGANIHRNAQSRHRQSSIGHGGFNRAPDLGETAGPALESPSNLYDSRTTDIVQAPQSPESAPSQRPTSRPDRIADDLQSALAKKEHIRATRRDATIKRHHARRANCECLHDCLCRGGSNVAIDGRRTSDLGPDMGPDMGPDLDADQVPDHHLGNLITNPSSSSQSSEDRSYPAIHRPSILYGVGSHVNISPSRSVTDATSSTAATSSHRRLDTWSQSTTVVGEGNGSLRSLNPRQHFRRSRSLPPYAQSLSNEDVRPSVQESLRNHEYNFPPPAYSDSTGTSNGAMLPEERSSSSSSPRHHHEIEAEPPEAMNGSSTSLSHLPAPDDGQGDQDMLEPSEASTVLTVDRDVTPDAVELSESQDITPTPASRQQAENGESAPSQQTSTSPQEVSVAIHRLATSSEQGIPDSDMMEPEEPPH